ncbi:MAG TPA: hypothetical protein VJV21_05375 [Pyrinomonadaceae bacterium]|nr:hypothetical protein [Pyrinomonadaceae bacterium]
MENEQLASKMEFIVDTLARVSINDEKRQQGQQKHERRLDRVERILGLMVRAGLRERRVRSDADERLTKALAELAEAQRRTEESLAHTDRRLDALIDIVRRERNGDS